MSIYTKTGDKGTTALVGGARVKKTDLRVETYGTVDELNAMLSLASKEVKDAANQSLLEALQYQLFY
nr:ATP:cob(I)alamin adenosyltransferase [Tolumonas sp.]